MPTVPRPLSSPDAPALRVRLTRLSTRLRTLTCSSRNHPDSCHLTRPVPLLGYLPAQPPRRPPAPSLATRPGPARPPTALRAPVSPLQLPRQPESATPPFRPSGKPGPEPCTPASAIREGFSRTRPQPADIHRRLKRPAARRCEGATPPAARSQGLHQAFPSPRAEIDDRGSRKLDGGRGGHAAGRAGGIDERMGGAGAREAPGGGRPARKSRGWRRSALGVWRRRVFAQRITGFSRGALGR